jgi:hypothetical protein
MRRHLVAEKSMFFGIPEAPIKHFRLTPRKPLHRAEASPLLPPTPKFSAKIAVSFPARGLVRD